LQEIRQTAENPVASSSGCGLDFSLPSRAGTLDSLRFAQARPPKLSLTTTVVRLDRNSGSA